MRRGDWWVVALGVGGVALCAAVVVALAVRQEWGALAAFVAVVALQAQEVRRQGREVRETLSTPDYGRLLDKYGLGGASPASGVDLDSPLFADLLVKSASSTTPADVGTETEESLLRRQAVRIFMERTDHLAEARTEAQRWLGSTPRSAKRLGNRLVFTVAVAASGGLLTTDSGVRGAHLGRWVALTEGWPRLAARVSEQPALLGELERAARDPETFRTLLDRHVPNARDVERLRRLLAAEDHPLGPAAWPLTRLAPVAQAQDAGRAQPTRSTA